MKIESIAQTAPVFDFCSYFLGRASASGWFTDRFGNVRRHFSGEFTGHFEGEDFVLEEVLVYTDGVTDKRTWRVRIDQQGNFRASSESLSGDATGQLLGNTLNLNYSMNVDLSNGKSWLMDMNDWMFLQPDGSLHNYTRVSKWGIHLGSVSTQYVRLGQVSHYDKLTATDGQNSRSKLAANAEYVASRKSEQRN